MNSKLEQLIIDKEKIQSCIFSSKLKIKELRKKIEEEETFCIGVKENLININSLIDAEKAKLGLIG